MDSIVHGVTESRTWVSNFHFQNCYRNKIKVGGTLFIMAKRWKQNTWSSTTDKENMDFLGSPVAKTPCIHAGGLSLIPGQGTRSHVLQLRVRVLQLIESACHNFRSHTLQQRLKIPSAENKTWYSQINKIFFKKKMCSPSMADSCQCMTKTTTIL